MAKDREIETFLKLDLKSTPFMGVMKGKLGNQKKDVIPHKSFFLSCWITSEGLSFSQFFMNPKTILWNDISCLDLGNMADKREFFHSHLKGLKWKDTRSFILLSEKTDALKKYMRPNKKIWFAGVNTLVVSGICPTTADNVSQLLRKIAEQKNISLSSIVLPDLF